MKRGPKAVEARFADGAWYDVEIVGTDDSKRRFLCKTKGLAENDEEWVDAKLIRSQSRPCTSLPQVGETVQALHRSSRSDLFFEGRVVATKLNKAVVAFSDGRVRGQQHSFSAQDLNIISKEKLTTEHLLQLSQKKRPLQVDTAREAVQFNAGNFVVIDGANEKSWVAQLMESFVGKISTEVDDLDEDGPTVKLRWLYRPDELPSHNSKVMTFDNSREVLLSNHFDRIDARLLVKKARIYFSLVPPSSDIKWESDELYCIRWWEPRQSKVLSLDHPRLKSGLRSDIDSLLAKFPIRQDSSRSSNKKGGAFASDAGQAGPKNGAESNISTMSKKSLESPTGIVSERLSKRHEVHSDFLRASKRRSDSTLKSDSNKKKKSSCDPKAVGGGERYQHTELCLGKFSNARRNYGDMDVDEGSITVELTAPEPEADIRREGRSTRSASVVSSSRTGDTGHVFHTDAILKEKGKLLARSKSTAVMVPKVDVDIKDSDGPVFRRAISNRAATTKATQNLREELVSADLHVKSQDIKNKSLEVSRKPTDVGGKGRSVHAADGNSKRPSLHQADVLHDTKIKRKDDTTSLLSDFKLCLLPTDSSRSGFLAASSDEEGVEKLRWRYADTEKVSDEKAIHGFVKEAVQHVCSNYVHDGEFKSIVYFMFPEKNNPQLRESTSIGIQRTCRSIGIQRGFDNASVHNQCGEFLKKYSNEKKVLAAVIVAEKQCVSYPKFDEGVFNKCGSRKLEKGLFLQLEGICGHESRRELWFIIPDGTEKDSLIQLNLDNSEAAEGGIMPALLDGRHV